MTDEGRYNRDVISKVLTILERGAPVGSGTWNLNGCTGEESEQLFARFRQVRDDAMAGRALRVKVPHD